MNILFPHNQKEEPSLGTQFYIQTIQKIVRVRLDLISFLEKYKNAPINEVNMRMACSELEHILGFGINVDLSLEVIEKMEHQFENASKEEIEEKLSGVYRIFSHKFRQIENIINPQFLLKDVAEVGVKNIDIHINTIRLLWLLNKKQEKQGSTKK